MAWPLFQLIGNVHAVDPCRNLSRQQVRLEPAREICLPQLLTADHALQVLVLQFREHRICRCGPAQSTEKMEHTDTIFFVGRLLNARHNELSSINYRNLQVHG